MLTWMLLCLLQFTALMWAWQYYSDGSFIAFTVLHREQTLTIFAPLKYCVLALLHVFCYSCLSLLYCIITFSCPRVINCIIVSDLLTAGTRCCCLNSLHVATRRQCCQHIHQDTHCQMRYASVLLWFVSFQLVSCDHSNMTSSFSCVSTSVVCCSHKLAYW